MFRTLTRKVVFGLTLFWLLLVLLGGFTYQLVSRSRSVNGYLVNHTVQMSVMRNRYIFELTHALVETKEFLRTGNEDAHQEAAQLIRSAEITLGQLNQLDDDDRSVIGLDDLDSGISPRRSALYLDTERAVISAFRAQSSGDPAERARALTALATVENQVEAYVQETEAQIAQENDAALATLAIVDRQGVLVIPIALAVLVLASLLAVWALRRAIIRPIRALRSSARAIADGDLATLMIIGTNDELGDLQRTFNDMVDQLRERREQLEARQQALETSLAAQAQLLETVNKLSSPLLPVLPGVVVLPIVGHVDAQRADRLMATLMYGISSQHAHTAIIDITGLPGIDTAVMDRLLEAIRATQLLGATVLLAGINPEMAHIIVDQEIEFAGLPTFRDLGDAVAAAQALRLPSAGAATRQPAPVR